MNEWIWWALIFVLVLAFFITLFELIRSFRYRNGKRTNGRSAGAHTDSEPELFLGSMTSSLETTKAMTAEKRSALAEELREAGFYRRTALIEYTAFRTLLVLIPLFIAGGIAVVIAPDYIMMTVIIGVVVAFLGYSIPRMIVAYMGRNRKRQIERGLPVTVDLLALALSGGQNLLSSLHRVSDELRLSYPVMAEELEIMRKQAELHSLDYALVQLADRVNVPEVRNLTLILTQSELLGTDITSALHEFSTNYRQHVRQRAEARANQASFWMLFPVILCLWIPAGVVLFAPVYFQFMSERDKAADILNEYRKDARNINLKSPTPQTPNSVFAP